MYYKSPARQKVFRPIIKANMEKWKDLRFFGQNKFVFK